METALATELELVLQQQQAGGTASEVTGAAVWTALVVTPQSADIKAEHLLSHVLDVVDQLKGCAGGGASATSRALEECSSFVGKWRTPLGRLLEASGSSCWRASLGRRLDVQTCRFHLILDLRFFDSLKVKDQELFCSGALESLQPGGLLLFVSEEVAVYGTLKRTMRGLRPLADSRLSATSIDEQLTLHAYRRASENSDKSDEQDTFIPGAASQRAARRRTQGYGGPADDRTFVEPARTRISLADQLKAAMAAARVQPQSSSTGQEESRESRAHAPINESEPAEWLSDALELVLLPGRGRGLIVNREVAAGELLMVSHALFMAPADVIQQCVVSWLLEGSPRCKQQFYALFDGKNGNWLPPLSLWAPGAGSEAHPAVPLPNSLEPERIYQILALNGFQADKIEAAAETDPGKSKQMLSTQDSEEGAQVSGLWPVPSLMNHACIPSTVAVPLTRQTLAFVAAYDLPVGAEVTNRYCKLHMPCELRRTELLRQKQFKCLCRRCAVESQGVPTELAQRLAHAQEQASNLDLQPSAFFEALGELSSVCTRELHACADAWLAAEGKGQPRRAETATQDLFKGSFASMFVAKAMASEACGADLVKREAAWREVSRILEQIEPCSPNHLYSVSCHYRTLHESEGDSGAGTRDALQKVFATWLGRHGTLQGCRTSRRPWGGGHLSAFSADERAAAVRAFVSAMSPPGHVDGWIDGLDSSSDWMKVLDSLRSHGLVASLWAKLEAKSALDTSTDLQIPATADAVTELSLDGMD
eukprot:TRINITY_DN103449_c0_g1_i1.p1 TRINITY_DN103449_c0_g1~~TRINITY_DN103449_c0_g1_i1.p1  ORF type:complete len:765 (+),score=150.32 TRINITY_DN103449_c0_g1_i1:124-2418(+)